ncbi:MAG: hypothetical protein PHS14_16865 [Elusimicrobia bacterium]|nr:hypothetical protein [Elusimicrobiota bacterium]
MRRAILLALICAGAFIWWRSAPKGVRRLDAGGESGGFQMDPAMRRIYYATGWPRGSAFHAIDLETGKVATRKFPGQKIIGLAPANEGDFARVGVEDINRTSTGTPYTLMMITGADAAIAKTAPAEDMSAETLNFFGSGYSTETRRSGTFESPDADGGVGFTARIAPQGSPAGIEIRLIKKDGQLGSGRIYKTRGRPEDFVLTSSSTIVAAYGTSEGASILEEIDPFTGKRGVLVRLEGGVHSMKVAGDGIVAVRDTRDGSRLSFVSYSRRVELMDLPWSKAGSRILGADPLRKRLYFQMTVLAPGGGDQSAWSVPMDQESIREAGKFFSAMHEWPELRWKLIGHSVEILIAVFVLSVGWYFYETMREI